jgi:ribonuclease Z
MIRVVVLGSSASMPSKDEFPSCIGIKHGGVYLFDACEGLQKQLMKFKLSYFQVKAIFITHLHADHFLGVFGLIQSLNMSGRKETLLIYGPKGVKNLISSILNFKPLQSNFPVEIIEINQTKKPFYSNELFSIKAFKVNHNIEAFGYVLETHPYRRFDMHKVESLKIPREYLSEIQEKGFAIINKKRITYKQLSYIAKGKKIVFTGDTKQFAGIALKAKNSDLLIHDSTFSESEKKIAKEKFHCTASEAALNAKKSNSKKLILTHFSNRYENLNKLLEEAKKIFPNTILAREGEEFLI